MTLYRLWPEVPVVCRRLRTLGCCRCPRSHHEKGRENQEPVKTVKFKTLSLLAFQLSIMPVRWSRIVSMAMQEKQTDELTPAENAPGAGAGTILSSRTIPACRRCCDGFCRRELLRFIGRNGQAGLDSFRLTAPWRCSSIILPHISGRELCQSIKAISSETPVIFSARLPRLWIKSSAAELGADVM